MRPLRPVSLAVIASVVVAWSLPAYATGNCTNGKAIYNKSVAGVPISCSQGSCHGAGVTAKKIQNGSLNPGVIDAALDNVSEMSGLRSTLALTASDIDDIANWIFYAPACPTGGTPNLHAAPATVAFTSTTVGATSATTTVTITNSGTGSALAVTASSGDSTHFPLSANTCSNVTVAAGGTCSFNVAFHPTVAGARSATIAVTSNGTGSPQAVSVSGTGVSGSTPTIVTVVEYHHAGFDHYFITPVAAEIVLLDAHAPPFQEWSRTGFSFNAYVNATSPAGSVAICRFFNTSFAPKSSHFYAPHGLGCEATLALFPDWGLEDDKLFNAMLPDANGVCPAGNIPVYRLYNNGMGAAPNHRFVIDLAEQHKMVARGFIPEGNGIGVGMCVPP